MRVVILDLAEIDLTEGAAFYEKQSPGIGSYFLDSLYSDIESLRLHAGVHATHSGYQRALSRRFPYAIYYKVVNGEIQVWRVLDCRRDPRWLKKTLDEP
jgi:plasmid stabilization system protein ParE